MRVFITGASGFIGRALYDRYAADGHQVSGCDLMADPGRGVVAGDVAHPGEWQERASGCDLFIHTAACVSLRMERAEEIWRTNVLGTANALTAAERGGADRFVHFSSVTVFGLDFPDGVDERYPVHFTFVPYPDSKIGTEQVVLQRHIEGRVPCTIVRPGDVYGPRSRVWAQIPAELIRQRRFILPGGAPGAALLHVARTVVRRAERSAWTAIGAYGDSVNPVTARYLNRLSDLLFILARQANAGHGDVLWRPGGER